MKYLAKYFMSLQLVTICIDQLAPVCLQFQRVKFRKIHFRQKDDVSIEHTLYLSMFIIEASLFCRHIHTMKQ